MRERKKMIKGSRRPTTKTYEEQEKISDLSINPLYNDLKEYIKRHRLGLDFDAKNFILAAKKADNLVRHDPMILDKFAIRFDEEGRDKHVWKGYDENNLVHRVLFYRANPWRFLYDVVGRSVLNETTQVGNKFLYFTKKQKEYIRDLLDPRVPLLIMSCNRGGSKTWLNAAGACVYQYCVPKARVVILGGSKDQSQNLYNYFKIFVERSELSKLVDGEILQSMTRFVHGGYVRALPASEKSVRGPRSDVIFLDEVCEADSRIIKSALPQVLGTKNVKVAASSTPHRMVHIFRDWWVDPSYGFKKHHWNAYECPWMSESSINHLKKIYSDDEFGIEVLGEFRSAEGSVFKEADVLKAGSLIELPEEVSVFDWDTGEFTEHKAPLRPVEWFHGVDWGFQHPTVLVSGFLGNDGMLYIVKAFGMSRWREQDIINYIVEEVRDKPGIVYADSSHIFQNNALREALAPMGEATGVVPIVYRAIKTRIVRNANAFYEKHRVKILKEECRKLIEQSLNYSYAETKEGTQEGKIMKVDDDYVDASLNLFWGARSYLNMTGAPMSDVVDFRKYLNEEEKSDSDKSMYPFNVNLNQR